MEKLKVYRFLILIFCITTVAVESANSLDSGNLCALRPQGREISRTDEGSGQRVPIFDGEDYDKLEQLALQVETSASGQFEMTGDASTESPPVAYPQNNESDNSDATPVSTSSVEGVPIFSGAYSADSSDYIHDLTINNAGHASDVTSYSISGANHTTNGAAISGTGLDRGREQFDRRRSRLRWQSEPPDRRCDIECNRFKLSDRLRELLNGLSTILD